MIQFSIIIPTYNRAKALSRALESLTLQTYTNFEVIVCDDGSKDQTEEIIKNFQNRLDLHYIKLQAPSGRASLPRNEAVKIANAPWICFLDSDDWWYPHKLESILPHTKIHDVIFHDLDLFSSKGRHLFKKVKARTLKKPVFHDLLVNHNGIVTSGLSMKKSFFESLGGFKEIDLEDYELWLRLAKKTEAFFHLDQVLGAYQVGQDNTTEQSHKEIKRVEQIFLLHAKELQGEERVQALAAKRYIQGRIWEKMGKKELSTRAYRFAFFHGSELIKRKAFLNLALSFLKQK